MTVTDQMKLSVEAFFNRLAAVPDNYQNSVFNYVAAKITLVNSMNGVVARLPVTQLVHVRSIQGQ